MQPIIRPASANDIPSMYSISRRAHQESYINLIPASHRGAFERRYTDSKQALDTYRKKMLPRISDPLWRIWVAEVNYEVVGYTLGERIGDRLIQKRGLFVDPSYYGNGIGSLLFEKSIKDAPANSVIKLSVIENNERAKRLYSKQGFKKVSSESTTFFGARLEIMERRIH